MAREMLKRLFSVVEAAEYLAVPPKRIYNAKRRGATAAERALFPVPAKRRGKYWVFEKADLDKYAASIPYTEYAIRWVFGRSSIDAASQRLRQQEGNRCKAMGFEKDEKGRWLRKHGAWSVHARERYSDERTTEGKRLKAVIQGLADEHGPELSTGQCILLDRIREKLIVLQCIGEYVDKQKSAVTKDGELLPCLGKGYTTYAESLRRDLEALAATAKQAKRGPTLEEYIKSKYGDGKAEEGGTDG